MKKFLYGLLTFVFVLTALPVFAEDTEKTGFGFIDLDGNLVIDYQFDYAYGFSSGMARVFSGSLSSYNIPNEGTYGYINITGEQVIPFIYDDATDFDVNGLARVRKNGKYGMIDTKGNTVVEFEYDRLYIGGGTGDIYYRGYRGPLSEYGSPIGGTYYLLDNTGAALFEYACEDFSVYANYCEVKKNDKYALIDMEGKALTEFEYDSLDGETETCLYFKKDGLYGYMDSEGKVIIDAAYDSVGPFSDGHAIVEKNGVYSLIDMSGNTVVKYDADYVSEYPSDGVTFAFSGKLSEYGLPDTGSYFLMDLNGNALSRNYTKGDCYDVFSGKWRVQENGIWYVLNIDGSVLFSIECDKLYSISESERYIIQRARKYAIADENGQLLTDFTWSDFNNSNEGLIAVKYQPATPDFRNTRWGMTEDEVKALEGANPDYTGRLDGRNAWYIGYDTTLMGNSAIVAYYFGINGLYSARYIWAEKHSNENLYITDYENVRTQLTNKYGSPLIDNENWDTSNHKSYYADDKGNALSYGYLSYETLYYTNRTIISMNMSADNYNISFMIDYNSTDIDAPEIDYSNVF